MKLRMPQSLLLLVPLVSVVFEVAFEIRIGSH